MTKKEYYEKYGKYEIKRKVGKLLCTLINTTMKKISLNYEKRHNPPFPKKMSS